MFALSYGDITGDKTRYYKHILGIGRILIGTVTTVGS